MGTFKKTSECDPIHVSEFVYFNSKKPYDICCITNFLK
ncbi:hypothetical protein ECOT7509_4018 [Escherichia coli TW07509]|nr:hypothetical protein ECOT7509_4018 [Escherichia coli TW07509]